MANMNKLRGKVIENGMSIEQLAEQIGIDRATLYRKIAADGRTFTVKEADDIKRVLNLSVEDAFAIFFNHDVA